MFLKYLPELSHTIALPDETVFVTLSNILGSVYSMDVIDLETTHRDLMCRQISDLIHALPEEGLIRVHLRVEEKGRLAFDHPRAQTLIEKGFVSENLRISLEKRDLKATRVEPFKKYREGAPLSEVNPVLAKSLAELPTQFLKNLDASPVTEEELMRLFDYGRSEMESGDGFVETASEKIGCIRLEVQTNDVIDETTIANLKEELPIPFEISVTLKKRSKEETHSDLKSQVNRQSISTDAITIEQKEANEEALKATHLRGEDQIEMEWIFILKRPSEELLSRDIQIARTKLGVLGQCKEEVWGRRNSLAATYLGANPHYVCLESDRVAWAFLPLFSYGQAEPKHLKAPHRATLFHRKDDSVFAFDPFDSSYGGCNILINGKRGDGKSVLANIISKCVYSDPTVKLVSFDVGSSYEKECELEGGSQFNFEIDTPSGLNVFSVLKELPQSKDVVKTLSNFLSPLILETNEKSLSKKMEADLEKAILGYAAKKPVAPSLIHFLNEKDVPRRELLERWATGIFENIYKETDRTQDALNSRYIYFNLKHLQNAASKDYIKGVFGAMIAFCNVEMLKAGDAKNSVVRTRLFLRGDEVPFISDQYAYYLDFTTANFRKFGHGTMLLSQGLRSMEYLDSSGELNRNIILNSPIRFFFQPEGKDEAFATNYDLTPEQVLGVKNLGRGEDFRECLLQTPSSKRGTDARFIRLKVTAEEYWTVTSDRDDNEKLYGLMRAVPGLTLKEAIRCLSLKHKF